MPKRRNHETLYPDFVIARCTVGDPERVRASHHAIGVPMEARRAAAVLGRNYPGSEWYERAYALMQRHAPEQAQAGS